MTTPKRKTTARPAQQPITAHRLFPAVVALWAAALFGLGSFAVAPQFLERAVVAIGLPAIVPATAPPLGFTARALLALALTGIGAIVGLLIGRRLRAEGASPRRRRMNPAAGRATGFTSGADAPKVRARDAHPDAPPRKPLTLSEDLVAPDTVEPVTRRRALAFPEPVSAFDPVEGVPLPGHDPWQDADSPAEVAHVAPFDTATISTPGLDSEPEWRDVFDGGFEPAPADWGKADSAFEPAVSQEADDEPIVAEDADAGHGDQFAPFGPAPTAFSPVATSENDDISSALPPFAAPLVAAGYRPADTPVETVPVASIAPRSPVADLPLDELGLVQLIERLALAMVERRERREARQAHGNATVIPADEGAMDLPDHAAGPEAPVAEADPSPKLLTQTVEAVAGPERFVPAEPPRFDAQEPQRVVSLRPAVGAENDFPVGATALDDDWDDGEVAIPRFLSVAHVPPATDASDATESDAPAEELYSSLLDITTPPAVRQEFVRVPDAPMGEGEADAELEPVVIFPGQGPRGNNSAPFERPASANLAPGAGVGPRPAMGAATSALAAPSTLPDPAEADRALRAALATLQRMTAKG